MIDTGKVCQVGNGCDASVVYNIQNDTVSMAGQCSTRIDVGITYYRRCPCDPSERAHLNSSCEGRT